MSNVVHYESFVSWEDGAPVVKYKQMLTKDAIADMPVAALSLPYQRTEEEIVLDTGKEFEGKSNAEVMNIRMVRKAAEGNMEAYKLITERVLGKPKQEVQSTNLSVSYSEFLENITEKENDNIFEAQIKQL